MICRKVIIGGREHRANQVNIHANGFHILIEMYEKIGEVVLTAMIFASCAEKGEVNVETNDIILLATAPRPYFSSYVSLATDDLLDVQFIPPLEEAEKMEFGERLEAGLALGWKLELIIFMDSQAF